MTGSTLHRPPSSSPPDRRRGERKGADGAEGDFDATLVSAIGLRMPGLHLHRFALHRPMAEWAVLEAHSQCWSKAVLFLEAGPAGTGPGAGTVVVLPPGSRGPGNTAEERLPSCVVFDFRLAGRASRLATMGIVPRAELLQAREQLAYLLRLRTGGDVSRMWEGAVVILNLLLVLLRTAGWLGSAPAAPAAAGESAMHRLRLTMALEAPLQQVVQRSGYQRDHLNRLVKKETGLTLGQFRAQRRLSRAKELLARGVKVGDVAGEVGLPDQSYFARWFRRQTGQSPSRWLHHGTGRPSLNLALCG